MKFHFIFLICISILSGCNQDDTGLAKPWGTALAEFNGEGKQLLPHAFENKGLMFLSLNCIKCKDGLDYFLFFGNLKMEEYRIDTLNIYESINSTDYASLNTAIGGDVAVDGYTLLATEDNFFEIYYWNPIEEEVKGRFQASFIRDSQNPHPFGLDTLHLMRGEFHTRINR